MSWQAGSFTLLGLVLVGGFGWYERSRPPSQTLALVAAMAALAVAGRVALAPIPNVVATTDIVLLTGYAIGAGPGFVTGALAAVVSNFWLGQGPWTPWQMAGWGMCGLFGAWLAIATRGRIRRLPLAAVCGLAGLAFGALMNFSLMVSYGGEVSYDRFEALWVRAIPFDLAHAIGNVTLALIAGPALLRMLVRFRRRFEVAWKPAAVLGAACLFVLPLAIASASGGAGAAVKWLKAEQNADGGFGPSAGASSNTAMTGWVALGLEGAGVNPLDVSRGGETPISYLRRNVSAVQGTGDIERTILAVAGAGLDPRNFGGRDLVRELGGRRSGNGSYSGQVNLTAFAVMAMRAAGSDSGVKAARAWLRRAQNDDGGWGFQPQAQSDADSTGAALQAVRSGSSARQGVAYLRRTQRSGGGFALSHGAVNSQSTAWAVQGLVAAGADPASVRRQGRSPLDYLARRQAGDGHYTYSSSSDQTPAWVTSQVLLAVRRKAFPLAAVPRRVSRQVAAGARGRGARRAAKQRGRDGNGRKRSGSGKKAAAPAATRGEPSDRQRLHGAPAARAVAASDAAAEPSPSRQRLIGGGAGAAVVLGGGYLLWHRRRYGSLPWS